MWKLGECSHTALGSQHPTNLFILHRVKLGESIAMCPSQQSAYLFVSVGPVLSVYFKSHSFIVFACVLRCFCGDQRAT